jgi:thiol-disulfide isomerase/thioredoxin
MEKLPNFEIKPNGEISKEFLKMNITNFQEASQFIASLPYGRNLDKNNLKTIFSDNCGTCSTKHATLKKLAEENEFEGLKLMLGIFKMNSQYNPVINETLTKNNLEFIPEAHNYLKFENEILDFTKSNSNASDFVDSLLLEVEILPNQISNYKVEFHKEFLKNWLTENPKLEFDIEKLWNVREKCIEELSN